MDWKYKRFRGQRDYRAPREEVLAAARRFVAESLNWNITDTVEGFTAAGSSFAHGATANFVVRASSMGTDVYVELLVERAGVTGFMLFDVGGYYNIQIRHWLDGIQALLHDQLTESQGISSVAAPPPPNRAAACLFNGCLAFIVLGFGLYLVITLISAVIGLATGNLLLIGRSGDTTVHGAAARVVSALILAAAAWIIWRIIKTRRPRQPAA